jgi:hypothetical protein
MLNVTFTGVDQWTILDELLEIWKPNVEYGILLSLSNKQPRNRYPSFHYVHEAITRLEGKCALHVCGDKARQHLMNGTLLSYVKFANRIQVNGNVTIEEVEKICDMYKDKEIITQHTKSNEALQLQPLATNHSLLVDGSGGKGIVPKEWKRPETTKKVGYAGGLGPDNLKEELPKIVSLSQPGTWIDMETSLRVSDKFNTKRIEEVLSLM